MASAISILTITLFIGCTGEHLTVSDSELKKFAEELFSKEHPDFWHSVKVDLQNRVPKKRYTDVSPEPFLSVSPTILETPIVTRIRELFDNYDIDSSHAEHVTPEEQKEEENFIDALLATDQIDDVMHFLSDHRFIEAGNQTYKETLKAVWFFQYARKQSSELRTSSGFEHVFLGELKGRGGGLIGMHNWIFINEAEKTGQLNYFGYQSEKILGYASHKVIIADVVYYYAGNLKRTSMFIGISPELEVSLYTLCYFVRPNKHCRLSMGSKRFRIQTYALNHTGSPSLGTAYPVAAFIDAK